MEKTTRSPEPKTQIEKLLAVTDVYGQWLGLGRGTVSLRFLNRGSRLDEIARGATDIGSRRIDQLMQRLSDEWPDGAQWPNDVHRPVPSLDSEIGAPA